MPVMNRVMTIKAHITTVPWGPTELANIYSDTCLANATLLHVDTYRSHRLSDRVINNRSQITSNIKCQYYVDNFHKKRSKLFEEKHSRFLLTPTEYRTQNCGAHNREWNRSWSIFSLFTDVHARVKSSYQRHKNGRQI